MEVEASIENHVQEMANEMKKKREKLLTALPQDRMRRTIGRM